MKITITVDTSVNWRRVKYQLLALVNPKYWLRNGRTDPDWDRELWNLIDSGEIHVVGRHEALVGGYKVWINNYPYASGTTKKKPDTELYCSRATAIYLNRSLREARLLQAIKGVKFNSYGQHWSEDRSVNIC